MILSVENEDCCFTIEPGAAPGQSYLCIPFHKEGHAAAADGGDGDEYCPTGRAPGTPPCRKSPGGGRRSDLVLLGCGALLAAVGLGCNLLTLAQPEENIKSRWEGLFHRTGGQRRSASPPTRRLFRRESPQKPSVASSSTLLSLSSVSDCNSTRSLLRCDSEELLVRGRVSSPQAVQAPVNPLVNTHLESFKRNPHQSLTPTHVPCAPSSSRSLRRTPSDGAIKKSCPAPHLEPLPEKTALETAGEVSALIPARCTWKGSEGSGIDVMIGLFSLASTKNVHFVLVTGAKIYIIHFHQRFYSETNVALSQVQLKSYSLVLYWLILDM